MDKLSIVIPAYNEEKRIAPTLRAYLSFFKDLKKSFNFDIIVVLNGCKDNTLEVVKRFSCKELIIKDFERAGKGFAITEGFKEAINLNSDIIGFTDADGSTPADSFYDLVKHIKNADGAIANRWDKKSDIKTKQPFLRKVISRVFNFIVRSLFLFPHRDTQCGAKVFKKELLKKINSKLGSTEWSFDVDLLFYARREGAKIISIPTIWEDKKDSHINLKKTPIRMLLSSIRLRLIHSPFRLLVRFYRSLPEGMKIHNKI